MSKFTTYLKTTQFISNLLAIIACVLTIAIIAFFGLTYYTRHGSVVVVPSLKNRPVEEAVSIIKQKGLRYKVDSVYVSNQDFGTVMEQDPDPLTSVKENRTIYLTIASKTAPIITLPNLENITFKEAVVMIENSGLKLGDTIYQSDIARDRVLDVLFGGASLTAGSKVPKGSVIDLVLGDGLGASAVPIPDLISLDLDAAKFAIKSANLLLGTVTYKGNIVDSSLVIVTEQSPMRTDSIKTVHIGTRINLTVEQVE